MIRHLANFFGSSFWWLSSRFGLENKLLRRSVEVLCLAGANPNWRRDNKDLFSSKGLPDPNSARFLVEKLTLRLHQRMGPRLSTTGRHHAASLGAYQQLDARPPEGVYARLGSWFHDTILGSVLRWFAYFIYFESLLLSSLGKQFLPLKIMLDLLVGTFKYSEDFLLGWLMVGAWFVLAEVIAAHLNFILRRFVFKELSYALHHTSENFEELFEVYVAPLLFAKIVFYDGDPIAKWLGVILLTFGVLYTLLSRYVGGVSLFGSVSRARALTQKPILNALCVLFFYSSRPFAVMANTMNGLPFYTEHDMSSMTLFRWALIPLSISLLGTLLETLMKHIVVPGARHHAWSDIHWWAFQAGRLISAARGAFFSFTEFMPALYAFLVVLEWTCATGPQGGSIVDIFASSCWFIRLFVSLVTASSFLDVLMSYSMAKLRAARQAYGLRSRPETVGLYDLYEFQVSGDVESPAVQALERVVLYSLPVRLLKRSILDRLFGRGQWASLKLALKGGVRKALTPFYYNAEITLLGDLATSYALRKKLCALSVELFNVFKLTNNVSLLSLVLMSQPDVAAEYKKYKTVRLCLNYVFDSAFLMNPKAVSLDEVKCLYAYLAYAEKMLAKKPDTQDCKVITYLKLLRTHLYGLAYQMKQNRKSFSEAVRDYFPACITFAAYTDSAAAPASPSSPDRSSPFTMKPDSVEFRMARSRTDSSMEAEAAVTTMRSTESPFVLKRMPPASGGAPGADADKVQWCIRARRDERTLRLFVDASSSLSTLLNNTGPYNDFFLRVLRLEDPSMMAIFAASFMLYAVRPPAEEEKAEDPEVAAAHYNQRLGLARAMYHGVRDPAVQGALERFAPEGSPAPPADICQFVALFFSDEKLSRIFSVNKFKLMFLNTLLPLWATSVADYIYLEATKSARCGSKKPSSINFMPQNLRNFLNYLFHGHFSSRGGVNSLGAPENIRTHLSDSDIGALYGIILFDEGDGVFYSTRQDYLKLDWFKTLLEFANLILRTRANFLDDEILKFHEERVPAHPPGAGVVSVATPTPTPASSAGFLAPPPSSGVEFLTPPPPTAVGVALAQSPSNSVVSSGDGSSVCTLDTQDLREHLGSDSDTEHAARGRHVARQHALNRARTRSASTGSLLAPPRSTEVELTPPKRRSSLGNRG